MAHMRNLREPAAIINFLRLLSRESAFLYKEICRWLLAAILPRFSGHIKLEGDPGIDSSGGITLLIWPRKASGGAGKTLQSRVTSAAPGLACCHPDLTPAKKIDGWRITLRKDHEQN